MITAMTNTNAVSHSYTTAKSSQKTNDNSFTNAVQNVQGKVDAKQIELKSDCANEKPGIVVSYGNYTDYRRLLPDWVCAGGFFNNETYAFYYDETSTDEQMILRAIGQKSDGSVYEVKIDPMKVDPSNATYLEMQALDIYLCKKGLPFPEVYTGPEYPLEDNDDFSIFERINYLEPLERLMENDLKPVYGNFERYAYSKQKMDLYLEHMKLVQEGKADENKLKEKDTLQERNQRFLVNANPFQRALYVVE